MKSKLKCVHCSWRRSAKFSAEKLALQMKHVMGWKPHIDSTREIPSSRELAHRPLQATTTHIEECPWWDWKGIIVFVDRCQFQDLGVSFFIENQGKSSLLFSYLKTNRLSYLPPNPWGPLILTDPAQTGRSSAKLYIATKLHIISQPTSSTSAHTSFFCLMAGTRNRDNQ